jgi:hypothetical protein
MSKTNDTSNLATLEDRDTLADRELNAVTGGSIPGESIDENHKDWMEITSYPTGPVGAWKDLLHQYGY